MSRLILAVLLAIASLSVPVSAQPTATAVNVLADASTLVVTGRVAGVDVRRDGGGIYTYATIDVADVFKGAVAGPALVVKVLGGTLPELGLHIADQAVFRQGEEVLLFLAVRPRDGTLYTAGLARGKWQIVTNLETAGRSAVLGSDRVDLTPAFRAGMASSRPHAEAFVTVPEETGPSRPAYSFIPEPEGGPARWHEADDGRRIPIDYQSVPGGLPGNAVAALDAAAGAWTGVNTRLELERAFSGPHTCPAETFTLPGRIALYWNDPCGEVGDGDSATFGVGGGFFTPGFQKTINGVTFNGFVQGLAILNNTGPHLASAACFESAVAHVLGHTVGLGHSNDGAAVMSPTLRSGCPTGLAGDDMAGLRAIYPEIASGGFPPDAPTSLTNSVTLDTVRLSWTPAATGGAAQSFVLEAGSTSGQADIAVMALNSPATSTVVGAVPPGRYHVRVRARNVLGTSGPSPDTVVNVGPCQAPGVPAGLGYTTADNLVTLSWTAPAGGVTQGYWLFAGFAPGQSDALVLPLGPAPVFSGIAPFGNYYVRVAARNSCATGPATADLLVRVQPCSAPPNPPSALSFTVSGSVVTLAWNAPGSGNLPSRYRILAGNTPGVANLLEHETTSNATSFVAAAPPGVYYVRVRSQNNCGVSTDSNEVRIVVP
jgi:hypothetical protein